MEDAGSVTILAAVAEGGAADEDVAAKCAPAANAHVYLTAGRVSAEGCPIIDFARSYTRGGLTGEEERACAEQLRRDLSPAAVEKLLAALRSTENNAQFLEKKELWKNGGRI